MYEALLVLRRYHDRHPLLRLRDGKLRTVQTLVLLPHGIEIYRQTVRQLADGYAHAACSEVVAALDEARHLAVAEQPLDLALLRCIALLYLARHGLERLRIMALGRARRSAYAVASRPAAQEYDHIAGSGCLAHYILPGRCPDHHAALQTLGDIVLVIYLGYVTRSQTDLVAIGGVSRRCRLRYLSLRELARERVRQRLPRIAAARDTHRLMHIRATRERISDAPAYTRRRAAEGLYLRRMIVRLVLEHQEPLLRLPVDIYGLSDGAGIDLLTLVQLRQLAPPL